MATSFSWKFPKKEFLVLRIEALFVIFLAILIYVVALYQFDRILTAIGFTIVYLALYAGLSYGIRKWRKAEEHYKLTKKHLEISHRKFDKVKKEKTLLKDVAHHKLDRTFLGGYLLTKKGKKHLLFFNSKQEVEKFESFLKKHLKKKII